MVQAGLDVLLGAGYHYFAGRDRGGRQKVDLLLQQAASGTQIITSITDKVSPDRPVIGLFGNEEMKDIPGRDPTLLQMAQMAVQHLSARESGYFLLIEEEMTDSHSHDNLYKEAREAIIEVGGTVNFLLDYQAEHPDVLLVFTADHETGGYIIEEKGEQPGKPKWTTGNHTGNMIPIFASGPGSAAFDGLLDNTDVGKLLIKYLQ
jgi:alkaline phosphatase